MLTKLKIFLSRNEFLKHLAILMSGTAVAQGISILAYILLARLYSDADFGVYANFMALTNGVLTIASWRYDLAIVLPKKVEDARALVKLCNRLSLITCICASVLLMIFAEPVSHWFNAPTLKPWLVGVGIVAWTFAQVSIFNYWCNRNTNYRLMSENRILQAGATTASQISGGVIKRAAGEVHGGPLGTSGLIFSTFLGQLVAASRLFFKVRKDIYGLPASKPRDLALRYKKMPLVNGPNAILDTIRLNVTPLLITKFFSEAMAGQYSIAFKLLDTPSGLINSSLQQVFYQRLAVTERGKMFRSVWKTVIRSALIGLIPFGLIYFLSPWLFPLVFSAKWAHAGPFASALVPWFYLNFITAPISLVFITVQRQGVMFLFSIPFTVVPIGIIMFFHDNILITIYYFSLALSAMLVIFILLALWVSWEFDHETDKRSKEPENLDSEAPSV